MSYVGIVLVSHSEKVVIGVKEIIRQVVTDVPIELAGGTEDNLIGTSVEKITAAIKQADQGAGVLVFYDLGSAKMNAELALELSDLPQVEIVEAPFIEGAYIGAVESSIGKNKSEIIASIATSF
ncbi:MAG TPA: dihydroxyacetone kinase phosphoryl donor subunit DhaM [Virgibacillus sp.]|nr:dihydroxyacetone kinase phosphoryl donor subunit DhaM [Virgibacillus sp.]